MEIARRLLGRSRGRVAVIALVAMSIGASGATAGTAPQTDGPALGVRFADMIMAQWPDPMRLDPKQNGWEYNSGIVLFGMSKMYEKTRDKRYLDYIRRWVDSYVEDNGHIKWDQERTHNLDYIQPATLILFLYEQTKEKKYEIAARQVRACYDKIPKNAEGGFWHKGIYPNEMWIDGIYMAEPFIVRYGKLFGDTAFGYDTAVFQTTLVARHAYDERAKLLYHAWDQDKNAAWANPKTGVSSEFWSRGMGWYFMALVDILESLPADHPGYGRLRTLLKDVAAGLSRVQDPKTGLWYQVLDKGDQPGNWIEVSGSAMYVYAFKRAVDLKLIDAKYLAVAQRAWAGLPAFLGVDERGQPVIKSAVMGMGVQKDYAGYIGIRRLDNSTHNLMAILLAASVME